MAILICFDHPFLVFLWEFVYLISGQNFYLCERNKQKGFCFDYQFLFLFLVCNG